MREEIKIHGDVVDWQNLALKKNIEELVKNSRHNNDMQWTVVIELLMSVFAICIENINKNVDLFVWIAIAIISVVPIVIIILKRVIRDIYYKIKKMLPGSDLPDPKKMIDMFDNETCYYVMTAESYSKKLMVKKEMVEQDSIFDFYFVETCFYYNKAISNLETMSDVMTCIASNDAEDVFLNNKLSYSRIYNILIILNGIERRLDIYKDGVGRYLSEYIVLNGKYRKILRSIEKRIGFKYDALVGK